MSDTDLDQATRLADTADEITSRYYLSSNLQVRDKPDSTPVTQADTETEAALARIVHQEFGDHYIGEEGMRDVVTGRRWVVDPIDGTKNYMRGMPIWGTLICLIDDSGPLASMISAPALGRRWWAAKGQGAWTRDVNGTVRQIHVSAVSDISHASLLHSSIYAWDEVPAGSQAMLDLLKNAWRDRAVGDFFGHMLVAEGAADASIEPTVKLWDIAASELIVQEAGGKLWTSADTTTPPEASRIALVTNGHLEPLLVPILGKQ